MSQDRFEGDSARSHSIEPKVVVFEFSRLESLVKQYPGSHPLQHHRILTNTESILMS